jgi:hypothetical protein
MHNLKKMENDKTEQQYQSLVDLVAVNVLTKVFIHQEINDSEIGSHQSDSEIEEDTIQVIPQHTNILGKVMTITSAWRLSKIIRAFFDGNTEKV